MKDFFNTANRDEYYRQNTIAIDCVELHLTNTSNQSEPLYFCSGGADLSFDSPTAPTAGTNVYTAQGDFIGFSPMTEDFDVKVGKFSIYLSGVGTGMVNRMITTEVEGKRVVIYKAFLNFGSNGAGPLQLAAAPILMFDGIIYNFAVSETESSCQVTIDCSSLFADFERTAGRRTNNWSNWLLQGNKQDYAFEKAGFVGKSEFRWGRL
jgi:hypothetical protein